MTAQGSYSVLDTESITTTFENPQSVGALPLALQSTGNAQCPLTPLPSDWESVPDSGPPYAVLKWDRRLH